MAFERYTDTYTGMQVSGWKGKRFQPYFYCDHLVAGLYITKNPVAKLIMTPTVQFINTNIAWDVSNSIAPNGTIDTFTLRFGGTTDTGDLVNQDWAVDPLTGNVQYTTLGTYEATLTVKDTTGASSMAISKTIFIVNTTNVTYLGTATAGMFRQLAGGAFTQQNSGLTSTAIVSSTINPNYAGLPSGSQHVFNANADGFGVSTDGADNWSMITKATLGDPTNSAGDVSPPATATLSELVMIADTQSLSRLYGLRYTATRMWLYWSDDYGTTWFSVGVSV